MKATLEVHEEFFIILSTKRAFSLWKGQGKHKKATCSRRGPQKLMSAKEVGLYPGEEPVLDLTKHLPRVGRLPPMPAT